MPRTELYIGNLNRDVTRKDIESVFDKYGRLLRCDVKDKGFGTVYAFLEFEEERDAEDALIGENGKDMCGNSMVVEWAKGKGDRRDRDSRDRRGGPRGGGGGFRGGRGGAGGGGRSLECYECGERGHFARDCRNKRGGSRRSDRNGGDSRRDRDRGDRRDRRSRSTSRPKSRSRSPSYNRSRNID